MLIYRNSFALYRYLFVVLPEIDSWCCERANETGRSIRSGFSRQLVLGSKALFDSCQCLRGDYPFLAILKPGGMPKRCKNTSSVKGRLRSVKSRRTAVHQNASRLGLDRHRPDGFSRLWLWGAISWARDAALVEPVIEHVRAAAQPHQPILFAVDGFKAYVTCILKVFLDPLHTGKPGRPRLVLRQASITRRLAHGSLVRAEAIMQTTQVELGSINTAYIERLNARLCTWMPGLVRRNRTPSGARERLEAALFWTGYVYNFGHVHATLAGTPAMAAGLTDHSWSIEELIRYRCQRK